MTLCHVCGSTVLIPNEDSHPTCYSEEFGTRTRTELARLAKQTTSEWGVFVAAVKSVAREDGTVHQCDMRPLIRGRIHHKTIATFYRRAKDARLLRDTGEREPSNDVAGRNTDKLDRIYELVAA